MRIWVAYWIALALLVIASLGGGVLLLRATGPDDSIDEVAGRHSFNLLAWEAKHFPEKWLYKIGGLVRDPDQGADDQDVLEQYFRLTTEIRQLERDEPDSPRLDELEDERAELENTAEDVIEGRVTSVLEEQRLTLDPPPFTDLDMVWPPLDFEFDSPPRVLAVSPRDRIYLDRSYLLTPGLSRDELTAIEAEAEEGGDTSALVVQTGGVATYPSVVSDVARYEGLVDTVFHEWVHQYLILFPLGQGYFASNETRTLNESVANIAGRELARIYFDKYGPLEPEQAQPSPSPSEAANPFDFTAEMRALRLRVEELLAAGEIEEAETLMQQKRDEFEEHGIFIRRLNQAYFAHYGFYADTAASIDPIGPKLESLLQSAESPGEFVRRAAEISTARGLDRLLAEAHAEPGA